MGGEGGASEDAAGLPFQMQLFHLGGLFNEPVTIHLIEDGRVKPLPFDPSLFRYDHGVRDKIGRLPDTLGYAGLRLHYPLNRSGPTTMSWSASSGPAIFVCWVGWQQYGVSARGLAVDVGLNRPEEFPIFREFWIEKPGADAREITL